MRRAHLQGLTIKAALALGFGLTLGVWLFAGSYFARRISDIQNDAEVVNARYMRAQERLTYVRSQVLLGSLSVRDALLDPDPGATLRARRRVTDTFAAVDESLEEYVPILDSASEHERVQALRAAIAGLSRDMQGVLTESIQSTTEARLLLNSKVVPQRDLVIRVSDEAQSLNRAAFVQQQDDVAAIYSATQRRLWTQLGIALGVSLAIALLATLYAGRLESHLRTQRER